MIPFLLIILVGLNLRPALSGLAPILELIQDELGFSSIAAGLLTTLPVLCLGIFAPLAPWLTRRFSAENVVAIFLLLLALGTALRGVGDVPSLFIGTLLAGASIGVVGSLLPGFVKRDFPNHGSSMTGVYTCALGLGAAFAAMWAVPLTYIFPDFSWQFSLLFWAIPALLTMVLWKLFHSKNTTVSRSHGRAKWLWSNKLAWCITGYMGLQSSLAYIVFGWLPTLLVARGLTAATAGSVLALSVFTQMITAIGLPLYAARRPNQSLSIACALLSTWIGFVGIFYLPLDLIWVAALFTGLGQGGTFSMALTLIVLRSPHTQTAWHLSGMVQGMGYAIAALGPFAVGFLRYLTPNLNAIFILISLITLGALVTGWLGGQNRWVEPEKQKL